MSKSKKAAKKTAAATSAAKPKTVVENQDPAPKPILRAIRVTAEVLEAAKAYKKATGKSFYALGLESISERLEREGYLKAAEARVGA